MNRCENNMSITDFGPQPFVANINRITKENTNFRTALWTGENFQVTLMSIPVGEEIGLEIHQDVDQLLRIEDGYALVKMGQNKGAMNYRRKANSGFAIIVPVGCWHNVINIGKRPLKICSIYAPPHHPFGTVHKTKKDAEEAEYN